MIAASDAARTYLRGRADLGAPINYDDLGSAALLAALKAMETPTLEMSDCAFMEVEIEGHSQRTLIEAGYRVMIRALIAEIEF